MTLKPAYRRIVTLSVGVALLVAFIVAGTTLRVPYIALGPGPTVNTLGDVDGKRVVKVSDAVDPNPKGNLNLTTVSLHDGLTMFDALGMWISGRYELAPRELYYPPDQTVEQVQEQNTAQMAGSESNATMAAMEYLNKPVMLGVGDVAKKGPAAGSCCRPTGWSVSTDVRSTIRKPCSTRWRRRSRAMMWRWWFSEVPSG